MKSTNIMLSYAYSWFDQLGRLRLRGKWMWLLLDVITLLNNLMSHLWNMCMTLS